MSAGARFRYTTIAHADRTLLGPLSEGSVDALLAGVRLAARPGERPSVVDVGCGKGEMLLRSMRAFGARGLGIDPNPAYLAVARERADSLGLRADLTLHESTLEAAPLSLERHDLGICTGSTHAFGDLGAALAGLARLVRADGWAIAGSGYWRQSPPEGYLALLGATPDEMPDLPGALAAAERAGWHVETHHASTLAEWDAYEGSYAAAMRRWLDAHPGDTEAPAFRERIEAWAGGYRRWGRDTLGFVTVLLRR